MSQAAEMSQAQVLVNTLLKSDLLHEKLSCFDDGTVIDNQDNRDLTEYVKFLVMKVLVGDYDATILSPSPSVDLVWHEHVLHTQLYWDANQLLQGAVPLEMGKNFVHHNPDGAENSDEEIKRRSERIERTLTEYRRFFGVTAPSVRAASEAMEIGRGGQREPHD